MLPYILRWAINAALQMMPFQVACGGGPGKMIKLKRAAVLLPERFKGFCAFGAVVVLKVSPASALIIA